MGDGAEDAERKANEEAVIDAIAEEDWEAAEVLEPVSEQALVIREERETNSAPASVLPSPKEWEATLAVARQISATQFVPESYRGKPESVVAAILTGREMGIGPMQSMRQIHMIDGRPAFAADLMMAKMRQGGVTIINSSVDDTRAYIKARRKDTGEEAEVEWTIEDAKAAGLLDKKNWRTYRPDMLWARCVGRLARRLGSDLLGGLVYSKEEMEDWDEGGYGGAPGYEATTQKQFDPETDLLEGAIPGSAEAPKQIATGLNELEPTVEWNDVLDQVVKEKYEESAGWKALADEMRPDFWRRLSNAEHWIREAAGTGDFPPVEAEKIVAGFAFAFSGAVIEVVYKEIEPAPLSPEQVAAAEAAIARGDDVPFGDEKGEKK